MRKADIKRSNRGRRRVSKNVWKMGNRRAGGTVPSVTMRPGGSGAVSGVEAPMVTAEMGRISGATEIAGASTAASRRQMGATSRTRMDDCVSVATLGSFGTASWVAGHFLEDESRRSGGDDGCGWEINGRLEESSGSLHACKQCSNEYDSRSALRVHMDRVHRGDSAGGAATAGFECPHCGKAFTRRSEMGRHVGVRCIAFLENRSISFSTVHLCGGDGKYANKDYESGLRRTNMTTERHFCTVSGAHSNMKMRNASSGMWLSSTNGVNTALTSLSN